MAVELRSEILDLLQGVHAEGGVMPSIIVMGDPDWFVSYQEDEYLEATLPGGDRMRLKIIERTGDRSPAGDEVPLILTLLRSTPEEGGVERWRGLGEIALHETEAVSMLFAQAAKKWIEDPDDPKEGRLTRLWLWMKTRRAAEQRANASWTKCQPDTPPEVKP